MKSIFNYLVLLISVGTVSCTSARKASKQKDNGKIDISFVQVNDVYEITPMEAGKFGGMARVATVKKQYLQKNPNTFLIVAGDFLSPSVYNSLQYNGRRIRGQQMVEAMNAAGMDIAVFGNHEFDINEKELQSRLNESQFNWVSSNTFHKRGNQISPFVKTTSSGDQSLPETYFIAVKDADGTTARIGFIGLTLPFNKAEYVSYTDALTVAEKLYNRIKDSCDAVVAITHLQMEEDIRLAKKLPGLAMILGGHEHDGRFQKVGRVYISKALANARSAYIVNLQINKKKQKLKVKPVLKTIDETVPMDSVTNIVVKKWTDIADSNYATLGFDAKKLVLQSGEPLDGRETEVRAKTNNFTKLIVAAMQEASPASDVVIINAGSIRVDDILYPPVTQYDIIRSLPFGGSIIETDMKGSLLIKILMAGLRNIGIGGFLHYSGDVTYDQDTNTWLLKGAAIDNEKKYKVALTDFLLTGGEANMDFLKKDNPDILKIYPVSTDKADSRSDIRLAIIRYMEKLK